MMNSMPGHMRRASPTFVPVFTPKVFASTLAAMQTVVSASIGTTPMGRPRRCGSACCSTDAKYELKSTRRERSKAFLGVRLPAAALRRVAWMRVGPVRGFHELAPEHERIRDAADGIDGRAHARD